MIKLIKALLYGLVPIIIIFVLCTAFIALVTLIYSYLGPASVFVFLFIIIWAISTSIYYKEH